MKQIKINPVLLTPVSSGGVSILLHGLTGSGKTRLLGTIPNNVVLDTEGKLLALEQQWVVDNGVMSVPCPTVDHVVSAMKWCRENNKPCSIDTITMLQSNYNIDLLADPKVAPKYIQAEMERTKEPRDRMEMQDWGLTLIAIIRTLKQIPVLKTSGLDVVVTSHSDYVVPPHLSVEMNAMIDKNQKDAATIRERYSMMWPALQGQTRERLGAYFDVIGYCEQEKEKWFITFGYSNHAFTKNAPNALPNKIEVKEEDHTLLDRIMKRIKGVENVVPNA
jgi:hypothetical protein